MNDGAMAANFDLVWVAKKERKKKKKKRKKEKKEKKKEEFGNDVYTDLVCHSLLFLEIYLWEDEIFDAEIT